MGVSIDDNEFASIIMKSLPVTYANHIASVSAAAHLAKITLTPNTVISLVLEEHYRRSGSSSKGKEQEGKEVVLSAQTSNGRQKGGNGKKQKKEFSGDCFNCRGKGHRASDWPSPKKDRGKDPSRSSSKGKDMAAVTKKKELDGVWSVFTLLRSHLGYLPSEAIYHL